MRQIKASEVKPGMTIRWRRWDISCQGTLTRVERFNGGPGVQGETRQGKTVFLRGDDDVLVVKEPAQPEEPTTFGAKVIVNRRRFLRSPEGTYDDPPWLEEGTGCRGSWAHLCSLGTVTVIPDLGRTAPDDTPDVPDRIEEWPEDDTALRAYKWRDDDGYIWRYGIKNHGEGWTRGYFFRGRPLCGPWDRVTDA